MTSLPQISTIMRENCVEKKLECQDDHMVPSGLYEVRAIQLPGGSWRHYYVDHSSKATYWILPYSHPDGASNHTLEQAPDYLPSYEECVMETNPLAVPELAHSTHN
ncbi:hypothetical protein GpartN1_g3192.t1 [Galdieria partita]|uniref:WW domain-containing protein n=1 Tax=Galdieria partita TaxID=83374 RepID=A0A9C7PX31_9RHOD|nr:hypothetical protein GpartN1_g3192.t1 [Galdieria partita]